jgi:hypothetical protein
MKKQLLKLKYSLTLVILKLNISKIRLGIITETIKSLKEFKVIE